MIHASRRYITSHQFIEFHPSLGMQGMQGATKQNQNAWIVSGDLEKWDLSPLNHYVPSGKLT